jgi:hypothetical protein
MRETSAKQESEQDQDIRSIPTWTRRYAQSRTLPLVVFLGIFVVGFAAFAGLSYLTAWAYVTGQRALAVAAMLLLCGLAAWWLWFSFVGASGIFRRITERLYRKEGAVSVGPSPESNRGRAAPAVGFLFMFCVIASVGLGLLGVLPIRYMQPVSALYLIPFWVYIGIMQRGSGSPFMWLWPAFYGIHAVLLVAGAPIYFGGKWEALNMLVPVVGYGLVAAIAGHIYSRVALRRLRALARSPEAEERMRGEEV